MAKKKKTVLPPKPEFGSIEKNKIIRAVNMNEPNPCTDTKEAIKFYNGVKKEKDENPGRYFSYVEPDWYEEKVLGGLL